MVEKHSIMSDHIVNWYTHTDFYHFLQWKKNIYYTSHTHGPICTFYHAPQIDDNLHKYISQGASAFHEYPYPNQTLISCFCCIPSLHHSSLCKDLLWSILAYWNSLCKLAVQYTNCKNITGYKHLPYISESNFHW